MQIIFCLKAGTRIATCSVQMYKEEVIFWCHLLFKERQKLLSPETNRVYGFLDFVEFDFWSRADVDKGEFEESAKDERHANRVPDVNGFRIRDLRHK